METDCSYGTAWLIYARSNTSAAYQCSKDFIFTYLGARCYGRVLSAPLGAIEVDIGRRQIRWQQEHCWL